MLFESLEDRRLFAMPAVVPPPPPDSANAVGVASAEAGADNGETASAQGQAGTRGAVISALASGGAAGG
jgi:hypothetical protein